MCVMLPDSSAWLFKQLFLAKLLSRVRWQVRTKISSVDLRFVALKLLGWHLEVSAISTRVLSQPKGVLWCCMGKLSTCTLVNLCRFYKPWTLVWSINTQNRVDKVEKYSRFASNWERFSDSLVEISDKRAQCSRNHPKNMCTHIW